jgi:hypothetical protein
MPSTDGNIEIELIKKESEKILSKAMNIEAKSNLTPVKDEDDNSENDTQKDEKDETVASTSQNAFLEVNETEKYKQFLIKKSKLETKALKPSETFDRLRQFLPMFINSTNQLLEESKKNPENFNIENVDEDDGEHIEMNLQYVKESDSDDDDSDSDDEEEEDDSNSESESNNSDKSTDETKPSISDKKREILSDEDEDDESEKLKEIVGFKVTDPRRIKKLKTSLEVKNKKPLIEVIESKTNEEEEEEEENDE